MSLHLKIVCDDCGAPLIVIEKYYELHREMQYRIVACEECKRQDDADTGGDCLPGAYSYGGD